MLENSHRLLLLKRRPYRDSEDMVEGFSSRLDRFSAVVRRGRLGGGGLMEPPVLVNASLSSSSGLSTLSQPVLENSFSGLRKDLARLATAGFLGRLFLASAPEKVGEGQLFALLEELFVALNEGVLPIACGLWGQHRLLLSLGVAPELDCCLICGTLEVSGFSAEEGGVLCEACYRGKGFAVSATALETGRALRDLPLGDETVEFGPLSELGRIYKEQFQVHLGVPDSVFRRVLPRPRGKRDIP